MFKKLYQYEDLVRQIFKTTYLVDMLIEPNEYKQTPMFCVVAKCQELIIMEAISLNLLELNWVDTSSNRLIHWACKRNFINLFDYLLLNGVELEHDNKNLRKPIHLACIKNNIQMVKLLICSNVDLEKADSDLKKPIDYAIKYGSSELLQLLLNKEVDIEDNMFYDIINYQDSGIIDWFLSNKPVDLSNSNLIWVTGKLMLRNLYKQTLSYLMIKVNRWVDNYLDNSSVNIYIKSN